MTIIPKRKNVLSAYRTALPMVLIPVAALIVSPHAAATADAVTYTVTDAGPTILHIAYTDGVGNWQTVDNVPSPWSTTITNQMEPDRYYQLNVSRAGRDDNLMTCEIVFNGRSLQKNSSSEGALSCNAPRPNAPSS